MQLRFKAWLRAAGSVLLADTIASAGTVAALSIIKPPAGTLGVMLGATWLMGIVALPFLCVGILLLGLARALLRRLGLRGQALTIAMFFIAPALGATMMTAFGLLASRDWSDFHRGFAFFGATAAGYAFVTAAVWCMVDPFARSGQRSIRNNDVYNPSDDRSLHDREEHLPLPIQPSGTSIFCLTPDDGGRAQRVLWQATVMSWSRLLRVFVGMTIIYFLVFTWQFPIPLTRSGLIFGHAVVMRVAIALTVALLMTILLFCLYHFIAPWRGRKMLRDLRTIDGQFTCSWDEDALSMAHPNGTFQIAWHLFHSWIDGPDVLLIRHSPYNYSLIPKRALAPGQGDAIVMHLRSGGVKEYRRFGIIASPLGTRSNALKRLPNDPDTISHSRKG